MRKKTDLEIDALIEAALGSDRPMVAAPPSLRRGVDEGVRYARMHARLRRRFRIAVTLLAVGSAGSFVSMSLLLFRVFMTPVMDFGIADGGGFFDYYASAVAAPLLARWSEHVLLIALGLGLGTVALGVLGLRGRILNN